MKPLKVIISAYACRPNEGSEPGVGWHTIQELIKYHKLWVFTRYSNRQEIEANKASKNPNLQFVYSAPPKWANWWQPTQIPHYYFWQLGAYLQARQLHQEIGFDIIHHVTYVRYSTPSFLALLPVPFIWGAVGGGEYAPRAFWSDFSTRGKIYEILRSSAHWIGKNDPFTRMTARRSVLLRATTKETAQQLQQMGGKNIEIYPESGLSQAEIAYLSTFNPPEDNKVRFISMARLLHWKGLHLGIRGFAQADLPPESEYWILGEGKERERLKNLTSKLGLGNRVRFWGKLPRNESLAKMNDCQVLVHPSLHDSGGWVCLEAMAAGRPVICLDTGGPGIQVTPETGFKIPVINPGQVVAGLASAMTNLAKNTQLCREMGENGKKRVQEHFAWETKGQQLAQLYQQVCQQRDVIEVPMKHQQLTINNEWDY